MNCMTLQGSSVLAPTHDKGRENRDYLTKLERINLFGAKHSSIRIGGVLQVVFFFCFFDSVLVQLRYNTTFCVDEWNRLNFY